MPELRYHHLGIPTDKPLPAEDYSQKYKLYASGYFQSPYGVEWMKFDPDCALPELVKTVPHVAFVVDDIEAAIAGKEVLIKPNSPAEGVTVAFIVHNGAPIEFLQFDRPESEIWPHESKFKITPSAVSGPLLVRHEGQTPRERSACGWRDRLISHEDAPLSPAAWVHAVDIDGAKVHYHKRSTELYYVLGGSGSVVLDGVEQPVSEGSLVHIPPGVVHGARGRMRVLVVGVPDIADDDYFEAPAQ